MSQGTQQPESVVDSSLQLAAWSASFVDPATERAYADHIFARGRPYVRTRIVAAFLIVAAITIGLSLTVGDRVRSWLPYMAVNWVACIVIAVAYAAGPKGRRPLRWALMSFQTVGGLGVVYLGNWLLDLPRSTALLAVLLAFTQWPSTLLSVTEVALSILPYIVLECAALVLRSEPGADTWLSVLFVSSTFVLGFISAVATQRVSRRAYTQERIIETQKEAIARERARSEELLKRELSHQVAERSRELGAVLAKSDVTFDVRRLAPGERFADRYKIVAALGAGAMGAVYEVERVTDGQRLALKALLGRVSGAIAARFAREAEIGARVRHPNVIPIVDVGVSAGVPYLAMELVRGGSLEAQRDRFGDAEWAVPLLRQIAEGLEALHDAGVVHRDLKPANVLLADGVARISDFGISRLGASEETGASPDPHGDTMAASPKPSALTGTGVVLGTPLYLAPEGAKSARALDASADVFALGIMAFEMLTGRAPFEIPAFFLAMADQAIPTPSTAGIAASLQPTIASCLAQDPARRPSVRSVRDALARYTIGRGSAREERA